MNSMRFQTETGVIVSVVTVKQMREINRSVVEEFGLGILQMMENTVRGLMLHKAGLKNIPGELFLADIGIPPVLYR